ncbi:sensor histidine kinase [Arcanobacterium phocisimile]|uniref:histidine kinase n=1 Tax=Arcanobacterium phocisimile TaxID=1302235 RepID=A0ABX7IJG2_9ACTO|nr:sensor histidine kinase [Arcanobacterium phocisimile]QRV02579.1 sensor histidine kinase [Arcanobacterium phocisimile]
MNEESVDRFPLMSDVILACLIGMSGTEPLFTKFSTLSDSDITYLWLLSVLTAFLVVIRRTSPNTSSAIFLLALLIRYLIFPKFILLLDIVVAIMVFSASARARTFTAVSVNLATLTALVLMWIQHLPVRTWQDTYVFFSTLALIPAFGFAGFAYRSRLDQARKFKLAQELLQQETKENQQGAVVRERTRIARDLHDIVAHTLGVVIAQADGGRYAGRRDPAQALHALDTIADMSRAALTDIRSIVGVLREPNESDVSLSPQPVSQDISALIERVNNSGYDISFIQLGRIHSLPAGTGNMLYRICQESVTNAMKHAGTKVSIVVKLEWQNRRVVLSVIDDGRGASVPNDGKGNGIIGMTERAALFGGTLEAGPRPGGGFLVRATIPYDRESLEGRSDG